MMFNEILRPWGKVDWIFNKLPINKWAFIGCLSPEARCVETFNYLAQNNLIKESTFWEILDPIDTSAHQFLRHQNRSSLITDNYSIEQHNLLEPLSSIVNSIRSFINKSNKSIIIDISSFPKRFFFPLIKFALRETSLKNLVVTYSNAKLYSKKSLAENPQPWMNIPSFKADEEDGTEVAIIGVGFMPLGLPDVLGSDNKHKKTVSFLFPFPPGPPAYQRTWMFVKKINEYRPIQSNELIRIDPMSLPEIFDRICAITDYGNKKVIFAPYGPKPMSLAMCLHAYQSNSSVYYTQPTFYSPNYAQGFSETFAYCIKIRNRYLYELNS